MNLEELVSEFNGFGDGLLMEGGFKDQLLRNKAIRRYIFISPHFSCITGHQGGHHVVNHFAVRQLICGCAMNPVLEFASTSEALARLEAALAGAPQLPGHQRLAALVPWRGNRVCSLGCTNTALCA
jgi:hypothetical protein